MEQIIIIIVIGIISMLFKGKKPENAQKQQQQQQRQPSTQPAKTDPMRKLKEMSQEMYKEIQREFQTELEEPPSRQTTPSRQASPISQSKSVVTRPEVILPAKTRELTPSVERNTRERSTSRESHRGRLSTHGAKHVWEESVEHHELVPKSERDLIKGIIFSEILGPPKAKQ